LFKYFNLVLLILPFLDFFLTPHLFLHSLLTSIFNPLACKHSSFNMEDVQQPTPTPDRETDSLFVPERSATPQRDVSVPVAEIGPPDPRPVIEHVPAPLSPVFAPEKVEAAEHEFISSFVQKLKVIEENAKVEMAAWDPVYMGHATEEITGSVAAGMKRKGRFSIHQICKPLTLPQLLKWTAT
jgi:hypothetical protein